MELLAFRLSGRRRNSKAHPVVFGPSISSGPRRRIPHCRHSNWNRCCDDKTDQHLDCWLSMLWSRGWLCPSSDSLAIRCFCLQLFDCGGLSPGAQWIVGKLASCLMMTSERSSVLLYERAEDMSVGFAVVLSSNFNRAPCLIFIAMSQD